MVGLLVEVGKAHADHYGKNAKPSYNEEEEDLENEEEKWIIEGLRCARTPL